MKKRIRFKKPVEIGGVGKFAKGQTTGDLSDAEMASQVTHGTAEYVVDAPKSKEA